MKKPPELAVANVHKYTVRLYTIHIKHYFKFVSYLDLE